VYKYYTYNMNNSRDLELEAIMGSRSRIQEFKYNVIPYKGYVYPYLLTCPRISLDMFSSCLLSSLSIWRRSKPREHNRFLLTELEI
jgi:hypothetical protein